MILIVFPNQLFSAHPGLELEPSRVVLIEDSLFFGDPRYPMQFHKQKLWLHRASMKRYEAVLRDQGCNVTYLDYDPKRPLLQRQLEQAIPRADRRASKIISIDPIDFVLEKRLRKACQGMGLSCELLPHPGFLNSREQNRSYRAGKKRWFMADFYQWQRRRLDILMDGDQPQGGQWSFDRENRKKVPKKLLSAIPDLLPLQRDPYDQEAIEYVGVELPGSSWQPRSTPLSNLASGGATMARRLSQPSIPTVRRL